MTGIKLEALRRSETVNQWNFKVNSATLFCRNRISRSGRFYRDGWYLFMFSVVLSSAWVPVTLHSTTKQMVLTSHLCF